MASTAPTPITVSIETGLPGSGDVTFRTGPEPTEELRQAFSEVGLPTADVLEHSASEVLRAIFEVQNVLGGSAGVYAFANVLKTWLHRNDGKEVEVTINGAKLRAKGMSDAAIVQAVSELMTARDDQRRSQLPDRFPPGQDGDPQ